MGLSEKLAQSRAAKEQKTAERQLIKAGKSAEAIVRSLHINRAQLDLNLIEKAAEQFDPANNEAEVIEQLLDKPQYKAMHLAVKDHLEGDWMADFRALLGAMSPMHRMQAQFVKWDQWRAYGDAAGLDEKGMMQALQVVFIFRKVFDSARRR